MAALIIAGIVVLYLLFSLVTVRQGTVAVITTFGKFRRILRPGLNMRVPIIETIYRRISYQNRSIELKF